MFQEYFEEVSRKFQVCFNEVLTEPGGNTWEMWECVEENQLSALSHTGQKVGEIGGNNAKEECLVLCRLFGLTGCEWKTVSGECYAHFKNISIGSNYKSSWCYKFDDDSSLGKISQIE